MLKTKFNHIGKLVKRFKDLNKASFSVGYYPENGIHPSSLSFAGLYAIHAFGSETANIPPRDPLVDTFNMWEPLNSNKLLKKQLKLYFSNIKASTPRITVTTMLSKISGEYVQSVRAVFGDESKLTPNAAFTNYLKERSNIKPHSPLLWSTSLRDNLSYSVNGEAVVTP